MGFALIENKNGGSVLIATTLSTVSLIPAYENFRWGSPLFIILALLVFFAVLLLSYIFIVLWNFSIANIFFRDEILEMGEKITKEVLLQYKSLEEAKRRILDLQSKSSDIIEKEAMRCVLEYMEVEE